MDGLQIKKEESVGKQWHVLLRFSQTARKCPKIRVSGLLIHFLTAGNWEFCTSACSTRSSSSVCVSSPDAALQRGRLAKSRREYVRMARGSWLVAGSWCSSADPPWAARPPKQIFFLFNQPPGRGDGADLSKTPARICFSRPPPFTGALFYQLISQLIDLRGGRRREMLLLCW